MTVYEHEHKVPLVFGSGIPEIGETIEDKYQVERVLGRGGMGIVIAALHTVLRQRVAVKFLLPEAHALPEAVERFIREAQSASQIRSEHVARVLDVGTSKNGAPYIVMEYLTGTDLGGHLKSCGPLPVGEAVDYVLQSCEALAEAHSQGIIHRDLKPANLFLTTRPDGSPLVKILDFGLSKISPREGSAGPDPCLTATTTVVGSPHYMSPEQVRSLKKVDARTDIWSIGVILYQLLTNRTPFLGTSISGIFAAIAADQPAPLRTSRPDVPVELEYLIFRCLEKDPARRPQTISELARELNRFGTGAAVVSVQRASRILGDLAITSEPLVTGRGMTEVMAHGVTTSPSVVSPNHAPTNVHNPTTSGRRPVIPPLNIDLNGAPLGGMSAKRQIIGAEPPTGDSSNQTPPLAPQSGRLTVIAAMIVLAVVVAFGVIATFDRSQPSTSKDVAQTQSLERLSGSPVGVTSSTPSSELPITVSPIMSAEASSPIVASKVSQQPSVPARPSKPSSIVTAPTTKPPKTRMAENW